MASSGGNESSDHEVLDGFVGSMVEEWRYQARVGPVVYGLLVALYAGMIIVGATGNLLVILVVVRNRAMRTARNVFIVNLAVSDLMLCLITMPLTLVEILYMTWQVRVRSMSSSMYSHLQHASRPMGLQMRQASFVSKVVLIDFRIFPMFSKYHRIRKL